MHPRRIILKVVGTRTAKAKSPAFARIKRDVMEIVMTVPEGRVAVCADMAECLEVMPRHVAYILATLLEHEEALVPWYRAVNAAGKLLNPRKAERAHRQAALLRAEGVRVLPGFVVEDFARRRFRFR